MPPGAAEPDPLVWLGRALARMAEGSAALPSAELAPAAEDSIERVLLEAATRMVDNFPYAHPLYEIGRAHV